MRVEIPEYFKTETKIMGLTKRQLFVVGTTLAVCFILAKLPGLTGYLVIPLAALPIFLGTTYLIMEKLEYRPTALRLVLIVISSTVAVAALFFLTSYFLISLTGFYLKTGHVVKVWGLTFIGISGMVFAFTDMLDWFKSWKSFHKAPKDAGWLDESVRALVPVERVDDDLLYLKNGGGLRSICAVTPVSAHSLKEEHQEAIYRKYREFLDSINGEERQTKVQIVMRMTDMTQKLDEYFERARKRVAEISERENNRRLLQHFLALEQMVMKTMREKKPRVPRFYLVISHDDARLESRSASKWFGLGALIPQGRDQGKRLSTMQDIDNTSMIIADKLRETGLKDVRRLNTNELVSLQRGFLTGLDVVGVDFLSVISRAPLCTYCATDKGLCERCALRGGDENMFTEA